MLRAYVATQRTLAPSLCADTTAPQQPLRREGNIIAYRRSGLVQRRALLRVGRRIAPCLLCLWTLALCATAVATLWAEAQARHLSIAIVLRTTIATTQADTPQYRYANTPHRTCILRLLLIVESLTTQSERSPNRDYTLDKTQYIFIFCTLLDIKLCLYVTKGINICPIMPISLFHILFRNNFGYLKSNAKVYLINPIVSLIPN